jgi:hypothetical protein
MDAVAALLPLADDRDLLVADIIGAERVDTSRTKMSQVRSFTSISGFQSAPIGITSSIQTSYRRPSTPGRRNSMTKLSQRILPTVGSSGGSGSSLCA